ncbi:alpha-L-fucosidase [Flexithrix dorotheae]|uniref:alpha-L-fucosidase n=1 Tax=Flexithrix dorotheae TaxID=70993 RepID=UPI00035FD609|nr:alpha-L-fucosidase [Flexithrix dorotheae]
MKKILFLLLTTSVFVFGAFVLNDKKEDKKPVEKYEENWESLQKYECPEWFKDAKLGIFIHWGAYSVPAYRSEWYPRLMYMNEKVWTAQGKVTSEEPSEVYKYHLEKWGNLDEFGYKDFIPMFKGENFNAEEWIDLFQESGAKYVVPVAEHHDSFAMYNSKHTRWNSVNMGPKRDILGELTKVARNKGMKIGASSHYAFNWTYFNHQEGFDNMDPANYDLYNEPRDPLAKVDETFMKKWWDRTQDIIDNYQPDILWFDFFIDREEFAPYHPKLAAYYYNKGIEWDKEVVLQTKNFNYPSYPEGTNVLDLERGKMADIRDEPWQTDTSIGKNSWGYVTNWISKEPNTLIDDLIDIVSKNGCLLLNVGPKADGTIPENQKMVLKEIGDWLKINGEAIYETRPWEIFGEGPTEVATGHHTEGKNKDLTSEDFRFTTKDGALYAICMDWPEGEKVSIKSLAKGAPHAKKKIKKVSMLGSKEKVGFEQTKEGLDLAMPANQEGKYACVFKIEFK